MSSAVGDQSELRRRKAQAEEEKAAKAREEQAGEDEEEEEEMDAHTREYIEYFRARFGENPRTDFLGVDGFALFCLIYVVVAGVVLSILYFSVYARNRDMFNHITPR
eukprot:gnl/TRDRNA2_/TRDRNA2_85184_c0_seq1.p1 gnl/TRDRNA2_/TRDRNA2_85184_c0~~gnl/TRDRNA2_/TRDRNA2_85184_c0_seq1.p1  ORF type:complete len:107 (+),score=29.77 gnl/TRDRNA2_/TRDRNA2_85184_c0_seq1:82-402(+)